MSGEDPVFEQIVVGVNQASTAALAAQRALELGALTGGEVHLVCALGGSAKGEPLSAMVPGAALVGGRPPTGVPGQGDERTHAENFLDRLARSSTARSRSHVLPGEPTDVILQVADEVDADLIVVGSKGMQGARRVLGSVPNTISHQADCSVLIIQTT